MKRKVIFFIILLLFIVIAWLVWSNKTVKTTDIIVSSNNLPTEFNNYKIAHISDFHNAEFGEKNSKIIDILKNQNPDIIAVTGDLVDSNHTNIDIAVSFMKQAVKIAPCFYVTGNHEAWTEQYDKLESKLIECGVNVLHDTYFDLEKNGAKIKLVGIDDPSFTKGYELTEESIIETKLKEFELEDSYTILLSHRPEYFKTYVNSNIDLVLTGHAHGGQFRLPFIGGLVAPNQGLFPKYDSGLFTENNTNMVVSRGIGNSIIPVRINNRPEVIMIKLQSIDSK